MWFASTALLVMAASCTSAQQFSTTTFVTDVTPHYGSLAGGTRITISGSGFSADKFAYTNPNLGNKVTLVSATGSADCEIHLDGCTTTQITCYTTAMREDDYYVRVAVDGKDAPLANHCSSPTDWDCRFKPRESNTPYIETMVPRSGPPGTMINMTGRFYTTRYGSNIDASTNGRTAKILRVYWGGMKCELRKDLDEFYGLELEKEGESDWGYMACKSEGTFVGHVNVSLLLDSEFGRSDTSRDTRYIGYQNKITMFQTYAEMASLSHSTGSTVGGTRLTITGRFFDDTTNDVQVYVADVPCHLVKKVTNTTIVCETPAQPASPQPAYVGNRGLKHEIWNKTGSSYSNVATALAGTSSTSSDYNLQWLDDSTWAQEAVVNASGSISKMTGFVTVPRTESYVFYFRANDGGDLYLSTSADPALKAKIASCPRSTNNYDKDPLQISAPIPLVARNRYYIEVHHRNKAGASGVSVGAKRKSAVYGYDQSGYAWNEVQTVNTTSTVYPETQTVTVKGFTTQTPVYEGQKVTVTYTGPMSGDFRLCLDGACTDKITVGSSASKVRTAVLNMATVWPDNIYVNSTSLTSGTEYEVIFLGDRGERSVMTALTFPSPGTTLSASVSQVTKGVSNMKKFGLSFDSVMGPAVGISGSASEMETAVKRMFGIQCPKDFLTASYGRFTEDFEGATPNPGETGIRTTEYDSFCGRGALLNPSSIFREVPDYVLPFKSTVSGNKHVCFAYNATLTNQLYVKFYYYNATMHRFDMQRSFTTVTFPAAAANKWGYACTDIFPLMSGLAAGISAFYVQQINIYRPTGTNVLIDDIYIGKVEPTADIAGMIDHRRKFPSSRMRLRGVKVTKSSSKSFEIAMDPWECAHNLPLLGVTGALISQGNIVPGSTSVTFENRKWNTGASVEVVRTRSASAPVSGTFRLRYATTWLNGIPADADYTVVKGRIESVPGAGIVNVTRHGDCSAYAWEVLFQTATGDHAPMTVDDTSMVGTNVAMTLVEDFNGGIFYDPFPGDMLSTVHANPQVRVVVNGVPSRCTSNCDFSWSAAQTPAVTSVAPTTGMSGTVVTVTGTGFSTVNAENNVTMGGVPCVATASTATQITCTAGPGPKGIQFVLVNVLTKGLASGTHSFTFTSSISSVSPTTGSLGGCTVITIQGSGFSSSDVPQINGQNCDVITRTYTSITCMTPPAATAGAVAVTVVQGASTLTTATQFTYAASATVTGVSAVTPLVIGGQTVTITGSGFGSAPAVANAVKIGSTPATIVSYSNTQIVIQLPGNNPGSYPLKIEVGAPGCADVSGIANFAYTFRVDAMSPAQGSIFGNTKVTIVGAGFNTNATLNEVTIGPNRCEVTSATSTQIECTTGKAGQVHVVDNLGTHPSYGKGYALNPNSLTIAIGDTVRWQWSTPTGVTGVNYKIEQLASATATAYNTHGFNSGTASPSGAFEHTFTATGVYYYWTNYVDSAQTIALRGAITVGAVASSEGCVKVEMGGYEATYNPTSGVTVPSPGGACSPVTSTITGCTVASPTSSPACQFGFDYLMCSTPTVTAITPRTGSTSTTLTIQGTGFDTVACRNEITVGDKPCTVTGTPTATQVTCQVQAAAALAVGYNWNVYVSVYNRGSAQVTSKNLNNRRFTLLPDVTSVTPTSGSLAGGTLLTIAGSGFSTTLSDNIVTVASAPCNVLSATYTQLTCTTSAAAAGTGTVQVDVAAGAATASGSCSGTCSFTYSIAATPTVTSVAPTTLSGPTTTVTMAGTGLTGTVTVQVGPHTCAVTSATGTSLTCTLGFVEAGPQGLIVDVAGQGHAQSPVASLTSTPVVSGVAPATGSVNGGTSLTIAGSGFNTSDVTVQVGAQACVVTASSLSSVTCTAPAAAAATVNVQVSSNTQTWPAATYSYAAAATPSVTAVTPAAGLAGTSITLAGTGFSATASDNTVTIDGVSCTVTGATMTSITCTAGPHDAGSFSVEATVAGAGVATSTAVFAYQLTLSSINPTMSSLGGGVALTLTGAGFGAASSVTVCGNNCPVTSVTSSSSLVCDSPPSLSGQACTVSITSGASTQSLPGAYTYSAALTSVISSVSPARGGTGGGTSITITGTGFGAGLSVTIDGAVCAIASSSATQIVCTTGVHAQSILTKVRVAVGANGIATQTNADFYYVDVWSSPFTWGGGPLPVDGDMVVVQTNQTVLLDTNTAVLKMLLIDGGKVIFDEKNVHLQAENILIAKGGALEVGTETAPFQHRAIITLHGHLRSKELPIYGTKTLALREGTLDLHGIPTVNTWTVLQTTAAAGATQITLRDPVDWPINASIVIATTGRRHSQSESEMVQVIAKSANNLTLTLAAPLAHSHEGTTVTLGDGSTFEVRAEVGLLSHNVIVHGTDSTEWHDKVPACPDGFNTGEFATQTCFQGRFGEEVGSDQFGGTIMIHAPEPDKDLAIARLSYIEVFYAGQAFRLGRYPIHFHLNGDMSKSYVRGLGIHHTFNRAVNIHGSHNTLVENTVLFNVMGGAFFLEDGVETGNTLQYNLAVFVKQSTSLLNDDITPAAFWVTNPNNTVRHNHAAGGTHFGFWYRMHEHPDGPSFDPNICPRKVPLGQFFNNTVHSQGWFGIWIFQDYYPVVGGLCTSTDPEPARFERLITYNCDKGAECVNCGAVQWVDFVAVHNNKAGLEMKRIMNAPHFDPKGFTIENAKISGALPGLYSDETKRGIILPLSGGLNINATAFMDFSTTGAAAIGVTTITGTCVVQCGGFLYKLHTITYFNVPHKANFKWHHEGVLEDMDGSLTGGAAGEKIVVNNPSIPPACTAAADFSIGFAAVKCASTFKFHRISFNLAIPSSLWYKDVSFTNQYGTGIAKYEKKRMTHPKGWMAVLVSGETYNMVFNNAGHLTNISYTGTVYDLEKSDEVYIRHNLTQSPDRFSVLPGAKPKENNVSATVTAASYNGDFEFDNTARHLLYKVSGNTKRRRRAYSPLYSAVSQDLKLRVYRCLYDDCILPPDPNYIPPARDRPNPWWVWSNTTMWGEMWQAGYAGENNTLPKAGEDVWIKSGYWVVADMAFPSTMNLLVLDGVLELDYLPTGPGNTVRDYTLDCTYIFVRGGRLIVGWTDMPYTGIAEIVLRGNHSTPSYNLPSGPNMGSKALGVFGGLDLHGIPRGKTWTRLANTANAGATSITLTGATGWNVGDEIMITGTGFSVGETEIRTVTAQTGNGTTLTFSGGLKFTHLAYTETLPSGASYTMAAEVGLLSHNIKIIGAAYPDQQKEAFGARVLVGSFTQAGRMYTGYARISNVEFVRSGQEGWKDPWDPRYSLAFLDTGISSVFKPSYAHQISTHHGYAPAIGVFGATGVNVTDCVVHSTVAFAISIKADTTRLIHNLVAENYFPGSYNGRFEATNIDFDGSIMLIDATNTIMQGNAVAGSERGGYNVEGESCVGGAVGVWKDNVAHSVAMGVTMLPLYSGNDKTCALYQGFTVYKAHITGIYVQINTDKAWIANFTVIDSQIGVYPMTYKPASLGHTKVDRRWKISKGMFVGRSPAFSCANDRHPTHLNSYKINANLRPFSTQTGGTLGLAWAFFNSGANKAPEKPIFGDMSYNAIGGMTEIEDVTFAHFNTHCGSARDAAISTNSGLEDGLHPMTIRRTTLHNVNVNSKAHIHRASAGKVNPADCVDMDCDAKKKALITDLDGTLLGSPGHVLPWAEQEWDGDRRHGVGDYRIPKAMLTYSNGSRIPIANKISHRGLPGASGCVDRTTTWQAYECHNSYDYQMMIIESLDDDTETRRLSPVAVLVDQTIDLINGPQDHGWCAGYTCQKRLSTFMSIVAITKHHELYFSSTSPQNLRFYLLNVQPSQSITMEVYYKTPRRMDVYYNGFYVSPKNSYLDAQGRQMLRAPTTPAQYVPTTADPSGSNYRDIHDNLIYVTVTGPDPVELRVADVIVVGFDTPHMTVSQFFGDQLAQNLATFLSLTPDKVRFVEAVSATGQLSLQGRRKRSHHGGVTYVLEVGGVPANGTHYNNSAQMTTVQLDISSSMIVDSTQLGNISSALNTTVLDVYIMEYLPNTSTPAWPVLAQQGSNGQYFIQSPAYFQVHTAPVVLHESAPFTVQPKIQIFDSTGATIEYLGSRAHPWELTATVRNSSGYVVGTAMVPFDHGWANFTDIGISHMGNGYIMDFTVTKPVQAAAFTISYSPINVPIRVLATEYVAQPSVLTQNDTGDVRLSVTDGVLGTVVKNISWQGHTWSASVNINSSCAPAGATVTGLGTRAFNATGNYVDFAGLTFSSIGRYLLDVTVTSTPSLYTLSNISAPIDVYLPAMTSQAAMLMLPTTLQLKFSGSYSGVSGDAECFLAGVANELMPRYPYAFFSNFTASSGSVMVNLIMTANSSITNSTTYHLWSMLQSGSLTVIFSGTNYTATQYFYVNGVAWHDETEDAGRKFPLYAVIIIAVVAAVLLAVVVLYFLCRKKHVTGKHKIDSDGWAEPEKKRLGGTLHAPPSHHVMPPRRAHLSPEPSSLEPGSLGPRAVSASSMFISVDDTPRTPVTPSTRLASFAKQREGPQVMYGDVETTDDL